LWTLLLILVHDLHDLLVPVPKVLPVIKVPVIKVPMM
jgi:hypothetical protein